MKFIYKDKFFELIVFSSPTSFEQESLHINEMFREGLECFHLRKPDFSKDDYLRVLQQIKPGYLRRVMLHDHFELATKYNVKGFHIRAAYLSNREADVKEIIKSAKKRSLLVSTGIHNAEDLQHVPKGVDCVFWSPVFDSISKSGYKGNIDLEEAAAMLSSMDKKVKIVALGGIDLGNLHAVGEAGFDGAALLGALWQAPYPFQKFLEFKRQLEIK